MQALLKKQTEVLTSLEDKAKQDRIIQLANLYETRRIDQDGDRVENQLKELNKNVKSLNDKGSDNLNSNVIKLFKEMQKVAKPVSPSRSMTADEASNITGKVGERRQFNTLKPRVENFKEGVKDFFTMRGFLDKTGIASRGSGGIVSEYLDRGEAKKKYVDQRVKTQGSTFGSRETFARQFDEQQQIQGDITKNEREIKSLRESGATDIGLKRSGLLDKRTQLATEMAKSDPSLRPEGFDPRTGKIKEKPESASEQKQSAKILPFAGAPSESSGALGAASGEEAMLEQNRMVAEQTGLLTKIEENTRGLKGGLSGSGGNQKPATAAAEEGGGFGLGDMLGGAGRLGKIAKTAGKGLMGGLKTAGGFLMKRAGPLAAIASVGAGAYAGYKAFSAAGDKQDAAKEEIQQKLESGEINEGEAAQLTKKVDETATVEKGGAVGKGVGMAGGGALGALKGAAAGAAIGSVVPVVGTVIGGAIGAGLGAVGGSWLGGKGGEWVGEKAGQLTNGVSNAYGSVKEGASSLWENTKGKAAGFMQGARGMASEAGEGLLRAKNKVSDIGWMAKENASNLIDRNTGGALTKAGNAISGAKNAVLGMFGMGDKSVDNGDGTRTTFKSDGTRVVEGPSGTKVLDKDGKLVSEKSPTFGGSSTETRADGSKVESYDMGPMSLKKETTAAGGQQTTSSYDLGVTKVAMRETLTPRQMQERGIDAKMAAGLPSSIPVEGGKAPEPVAAAAPQAGGRVSKIAGEPWSPGTDLSEKQLAVIEQGIAGGTNYSFRVMEQYDKQKGNSRAPVTGGATVSAPEVPGIGNNIAKQSGDNEQAKLDSGKGGGNSSIVAAPTINNNNNVQNTPVKLAPRNGDSTVNKYMQSRWAF